MKRSSHKVNRVGLIGHPGKIACSNYVAQAARLIRAAGRKVLADTATAQSAKINVPTFTDPAALANEVDLLLVFGGDGTMLGLAREIAGTRTPMLGVNIGGLGFLTAVSSADLATALKHIWKGEFNFESRALIEATAKLKGRLYQQTALNDIVVGRGPVTRLIDLDVEVDGEPLTRYRCDGLIVSSPTGSTAYSLAAGGALVFPTADVFALTPISPHTLTNRSLILPLTSTIRIKANSPSTILSADGQVVEKLGAGDIVTVRRSRRAVRLMHLAGSSYFEALRRKLQWRGAYL